MAAPRCRQPDNTAEPVWLGRFAARTDDLCQGACGAIAIARAAWLYRARVLVLTLCAKCCELAERASQRRVRIFHHPPHNLYLERCDGMRTVLGVIALDASDEGHDTTFEMPATPRRDRNYGIGLQHAFSFRRPLR